MATAKLTENFDSYANLTTVTSVNSSPGGAWSKAYGTSVVTNTYYVSSPNSLRLTGAGTYIGSTAWGFTMNAGQKVTVTFTVRLSDTSKVRVVGLFNRYDTGGVMNAADALAALYFDNFGEVLAIENSIAWANTGISYNGGVQYTVTLVIDPDTLTYSVDIDGVDGGTYNLVTPVIAGFVAYNQTSATPSMCLDNVNVEEADPAPSGGGSILLLTKHSRGDGHR